MAGNYIDENIDALRSEFKWLDHWIYLNAGDQMIPGNYWLKVAREFYNFVEYGRMEDIPSADIATYPFLLSAWEECIERAARLINADKDEVTNTYRPAITAKLIFYNMFDWFEGDNIVFSDLSYPSFVYILQDVRRRYGVELRVIKNVDGVVRMEDMEQAVDERTRMVVIDRTAAFSGFTRVGMLRGWPGGRPFFSGQLFRPTLQANSSGQLFRPTLQANCSGQQLGLGL